jgi:hypothetical protein
MLVLKHSCFDTNKPFFNLVKNPYRKTYALVTMLEDFKTIVKSQLYPIMYIEDQWIIWIYFREWQRYNVQEYNTEFRNMAIVLCIYLKNFYVLLKYLGGLQNHPRKKVILFNPKTVDEACV